MKFFDKVGKWIDESMSAGDYALYQTLKGFTAVDTPVTANIPNDTPIGQLATQAEWTLSERNSIFNNVDIIADTHLANTIKDIIISDGFSDLSGGNKAVLIRYTDEDNIPLSEELTNEIEKFLKRTNLIDILKDCITNEGMNYGEVFLSTPCRYGEGIISVSDNLDLKELLAIYKNSELVGALKFETIGKRSTCKNFIKANNISHFMLNYMKKPIKISKSFVKKYNISEKIRVAKPILSDVVDLIIQYNALEKIQTAIELMKATQGVFLGIGISPDQDIEAISRQLQEFSATFNQNRQNVLNNLQTLDVETLLNTMNKVEFAPYSVEEGTNTMRQIDVKYPEMDLSAKLNNILKVIARAVGVPEQNLASIEVGSIRDSKEDSITTNPRYSRMLSRIIQLLSKGIRDTVYKNLKYKYSKEDGTLTKPISKDKIEILFEATTNLNDRLEDESLLLKAETVGSIISIIEGVASSPEIPCKVKGDMLIKYWKKQMHKDIYLRDSIELMSEEEIEKQRGEDYPDELFSEDPMNKEANDKEANDKDISKEGENKEDDIREVSL